MDNYLNSLHCPVSKKKNALPIDTPFKLPSPLPPWPPGQGFASGSMDLGGGLQVCQISTFNKVWATYEGGPDNLGATFFEPSALPQGFCMLGCYAQSNNTQLCGWLLAAQINTDALTMPIDYTLVWTSETLKIKQDGFGYFWLPLPPDGYKPVGFLVTNSSDKPPPEKIRCVRSDLTDNCEIDSWIWGAGDDKSGLGVYDLRPSNRGVQAMGVSVGSFLVKPPGANNTAVSLSCLKNTSSNPVSCMPNITQIQSIFNSYSPWIYFHPEEKYLPSSVNWFFTNGALLYEKGQESQPVLIEPNGSNLPQGGSNDGNYWLDLPVDENAKERVKEGDLQSCQVYLHVKPMLGATFTDIAIWVFFPFNGPARAKVEFINISLGKIGEHVGDWEHVTLRVSNLNAQLYGVYLSQHSRGRWVKASELEFEGGNKPVVYASLHGHAMYPRAGLVLQGRKGIGIRNDTGKSQMVIDAGANSYIVAAEYMGSAGMDEPPWLNYFRKWGPRIDYDIEEVVRKVAKVLPGTLKSSFKNFINSLPRELLGEEGPTGPKMKHNWTADED